MTDEPPAAGRANRPREAPRIDDALARLGRWTPVGGTERVGLAASLSRVLGEDVAAGGPVPSYRSSAMDGYAFRHADWRRSRSLPVAGRVLAGQDAPALPANAAIRIFTGAALPEGADTVAVQERCEATADTVQLPASVEAGENCRAVGEDVAEGEVVLEAGTRLLPFHLGAAAALGRSHLLVRRRVRVALLSVGDELRDPGQPLPPGCSVDSNRTTLGACLSMLGADVEDRGLLPDQEAAVRNAIAALARDHDLVVSSGGVSVGEADWIGHVLRTSGDVVIDRLPMKPGAPVIVGDVGGKPVVGLPGNPVSALIAFWIVGRPLLLRLTGREDLVAGRLRVKAGEGFRHRTGRTDYVRARLVDVGDVPTAFPTASTGTGIVSPLISTDGLLVIAEDRGDVSAGEALEFIPYSALLR